MYNFRSLKEKFELRGKYTEKIQGGLKKENNKDMSRM